MVMARFKPKRLPCFMVEATVYHILPPTIWANLDAEGQQPANVISATGTQGWHCDWLAADRLYRQERDNEDKSLIHTGESSHNKFG